MTSASEGIRVGGGGIPVVDVEVGVGVGSSTSNSSLRKEKQQQQQQQQQVARSGSFQYQQQQQQQQLEAFPFRGFTCNNNNNNRNTNDKLLFFSPMACNRSTTSSSCSSSSSSSISSQHHRYFPDLMISTNSSTICPPPPPPPQPPRFASTTTTTDAAAATTSTSMSYWSNPSGAAAIATATTINSHLRHQDSGAEQAPPEEKEEEEEEEEEEDDEEEEEDNDDDNDGDDDDDDDLDDDMDDEDNHCDDHKNNNKHKSILFDTGLSGQVIMLKDGDPPPPAAADISIGQASAPRNNNDPVVGGVGMVTIAKTDRDAYLPQYLRHATEGSCCDGADGSGARGSHLVALNGCTFSGTKNKDKEKQVPILSAGSGDSLRSTLSDPVTGALMDDAFILPCGHSFGGDGLQHVIKMKACYTCSRSISEDSISPNLSLQTAVQAFRREEEMRRCFKRRRERSDQDKGTNVDSNVTDTARGRGLQFPFAVTDRVIIKGNKRTPQRFIGREAIVTTQCLNGWYVVKTLDNAESVKLQYRSLAKVPQESSPKTISSKMAPIWHQ